MMISLVMISPMTKTKVNSNLEPGLDPRIQQPTAFHPQPPIRVVEQQLHQTAQSTVRPKAQALRVGHAQQLVSQLSWDVVCLV